MQKEYSIIASSRNFIEDAAIDQLKQAATLPGVEYAVGLPDLHPGKGGPVGAAMLSKDMIYPYFIGGDIGCGMRFSLLRRSAKKMKTERWVKRFLESNDFSLPKQWQTKSAESENLIKETPFDAQLGTIGSGNHFAEFSTVETVKDAALFQKYNLEKEGVYLLIHSGSRGLGNHIYRRYVDRYKAGGLAAQSPEFDNYMNDHQELLGWARRNRQNIARKLLHRLGTDDTFLWDNVHNFVEKIEIGGNKYYLHRKGAVKSGEEPVVIPGSRGSLSYLVQPVRCDRDHLFSLAHGAGRKWNRVKSRQKSKIKYKGCDIRRVQGHAVQVSWDKEALWEEAPEAYKNINVVIEDLENAGLIQVIASFRPRITVKIDLQGAPNED